MGRTKKVIRPERTNKQGRTSIYIKYTHNSLNTYFSVGELIEPKYWDLDKQEVRKSYRGHSVLNELAQTLQEKIDEIKRKLMIQGIEPSTILPSLDYHIFILAWNHAIQSNSATS